MKNNSHSESREDRLARFVGGAPIESIETLLNSIDNFFNNEIRVTPQYHQTSLLFLGVHAVALTISEAFFDKNGKAGFKLFLEHFVDGETTDLKFSLISPQIHNWRNVLAHQWLGTLGHTIQYDYEMQEGWKVVDGITVINPRLYCSSYLDGFSSGGQIWRYEEILGTDGVAKANERIINKYKNH